MDKMLLSIWEVVLGAPDRVNIRASCMTRASVRLMLKCQITSYSTKPKRYKYKTCHDVKTAYITYMPKDQTPEA